MKLKKRKIRTFLVGILFCCTIFIIISVLYFPRTLLIDFLFYEEHPEKADAIVLISGSAARINKAADLYYAGYADKVLLTNSMAHGSRVEDAESFGIPLEALLIENKATSTYENALYSKEIILENDIKSAIVVTSNYHMRRTKLAFERVFYDSDVTFTYVPYHHDTITRDSWAENERLFKREYKKLIGGYFLYFDGPITPLRKKFEKIMKNQS